MCPTVFFMFVIPYTHITLLLRISWCTSDNFPALRPIGVHKCTFFHDHFKYCFVCFFNSSTPLIVHLKSFQFFFFVFCIVYDPNVKLYTFVQMNLFLMSRDIFIYFCSKRFFSCQKLFLPIPIRLFIPEVLFLLDVILLSGYTYFIYLIQFLIILRFLLAGVRG